MDILGFKDSPFAILLWTKCTVFYKLCREEMQLFTIFWDEVFNFRVTVNSKN